MADNCPILEGCPFDTAFPDGCWVSDAITHETETLTRALQISLSTDTDALAAVAAATGWCPSFLVKPEPAASGSASDAENPAPSRFRRPTLQPPAGKISKRKSRASKRSTTTFIAADPANFRQMVQQVTGVRSDGPHSVADAAALRPEPRGPGWLLDCLPTLDTSALLLGRGGPAAGSSASPSPDSHAEITFQGTELDAEFAPLLCFPTLESWGVI